MIYLKELTLRNVNNKYLNWMNDSEVHKFTEQKYYKHKLRNIKEYVKEKKNSNSEFLYGIFLKYNQEHIGNIKLGPIDYNNKTSRISYFIGNKNMWGKGYTGLAIRQIIIIAKKKKLKKLNAECYSINIGSKKVLLKNKFKLEGTLKSHVFYKNKRLSAYLFGLVL